ncbi:MAG: tetratricopeptide repeat protein [Deltaproteobacteria bacterium]|nr:tetratricopeptide repeat protein [Deltaproteobacteria bacterium]
MDTPPDEPVVDSVAPVEAAPVEAALAEVMVPSALAEEPPAPVADIPAAAADASEPPIQAPEPVAPPPMILAPDPVAALADTAAAAPDPMLTAGGRPRRASVVAAGGSEPENAVSPTRVRAVGPSLDDEAISSGTHADDDLLGSGTSAAGRGIQLDLGGKKGPTPPRGDGGAPRLTDEEEPHTAAMAESPSIKPAGDDARIAGLLDEAIAAAGQGDLNRAIQAFTDVLDMRHDRADAHIGRGRCYLELGDYSSAMSDFQRAEDLHPERPDAHVAMGDLYFARKEYRRAIEFYDQAVDFDGSHAMARCRRGISHYYRKNYRQAFQDLQRAHTLEPEIPNIRKYVQMALKKMEQPD